MATWTAPTTRSTGDLISASIFNTDLVENLKYLKDAPVFDTAAIIGAATTAGIRLDLESGVLAVREGDDSAYGPLRSGIHYIVGSTPAATPTWQAADSAIVSGTDNNVLQLHSGTNSGSQAVAFSVGSTRSKAGFGYDNSNDALYFTTNSTERMRLTSGGVLHPSTNDAATLGSSTLQWSDLYLASGALIDFANNNVRLTHASGALRLTGADFSVAAAKKIYLDGGTDTYIEEVSGNVTRMVTNNAERQRWNSDGTIFFQKATTDNTTLGSYFEGTTNALYITTGGTNCILVNRQTDDGGLINFSQANATEGSISVSGATVSYNTFVGSHWSQFADGSKPAILRGTVLEAIDQMCVWPGEQNETLPCVKVSDTAASTTVYGVFLDWDNDWTATNDLYCTALGAFICRIHPSVTVQLGDLLESNGDGTARVQADTVVRSSTIGKVTNTTHVLTHPDGSYCVPTTICCG